MICQAMIDVDIHNENNGVKYMKKIEQTAFQIQQNRQLFRCPICQENIVLEDKTVICAKGHRFDLAKKGYVNFLMQASPNDYTKVLFEARHQIIQSGMYDRLHQVIAEEMGKFQNQSTVSVLDIGCGEGSHLAQIVSRLKRLDTVGVGVDISKDGITTAAKYYPEFLWAVGDLAKSPFQTKQFDILLNILSPANYQEFDRLLHDDGIVIKVVPRSKYLKEIRELVLDKSKQTYQNTEAMDTFHQHYAQVKSIEVQYEWSVPESLRTSLLKMTPLTWNKISENKMSELAENLHVITVDLQVLVGRNSDMGGV
ncbi:putative RNA methyltransferase [Gracilibacillus sp. YIM 98692]|uniref:putative RNA methyltransferase n=1 Tax=Gracilibacillus sp. YIM 98692 TaxID=2663532 RepID=UPI00196A1A74|nr:methyltransferase domain-containing protein [Gracilibacillus sp. YIM 98692]